MIVSLKRGNEEVRDYRLVSLNRLILFLICLFLQEEPEEPHFLSSSSKERSNKDDKKRELVLNVLISPVHDDDVFFSHPRLTLFRNWWSERQKKENDLNVQRAQFVRQYTNTMPFGRWSSSFSAFSACLSSSSFFLSLSSSDISSSTNSFRVTFFPFSYHVCILSFWHTRHSRTRSNSQVTGRVCAFFLF